ncbi:MAG: hypothetical protein ACP5VS_19365, partial [Desulfomonilaceae bacterium]
DGPQQGAFCGNPDMPVVGEVQRAKKRFPPGFVFKDNGSDRCQLLKPCLGKLSLIYVIKRFAVWCIIILARPGNFQKVDSILAVCTLKPGEYLFIDIGAVTVISLMPCARAIDIYVARDLQTDAEDLFLFSSCCRVLF